jgi:hypothetical protein
MVQDHAAIDAMFEKTVQVKRDQLTDWTAWRQHSKPPECGWTICLWNTYALLFSSVGNSFRLRKTCSIKPTKPKSQKLWHVQRLQFVGIRTLATGPGKFTSNLGGVLPMAKPGFGQMCEPKPILDVEERWRLR